MKILWSAVLHMATINRPNWSTHEKTTYESDALLRDRTPLWNPGWLRNCHRTSFTTRRSSTSLVTRRTSTVVNTRRSLVVAASWIRLQISLCDYQRRHHQRHQTSSFTNAVCLHSSVIQICLPLRPAKLLTSHCDPKTGSSQTSFHQSITYLSKTLNMHYSNSIWLMPSRFF